VKSALGDALKGFAAPLRALLVALVGAWWASLWFRGTWWTVAVVVVAVVAVMVGLLIDYAGRHVSAEKPKRKISLMEWWILIPMVLAAVAAAAAIIVTVTLTVPDGTPAATKETIGAVATAITSFLSAGFIERAGDEDQSRVSNRIRDHFCETYEDTFARNSAAELYAFSASYGNATGWGRAARLIRAKGMEENWASDKVA
jgi:heme/copper-type cytochrome/quinol oxidase subunit 2